MRVLNMCVIQHDERVRRELHEPDYVFSPAPIESHQFLLVNR